MNFKFNLILLWKLIRHNPIKSIAVLSTILSFMMLNGRLWVDPIEVMVYESLSGPTYVGPDTLYLGQLMDSESKYKIIQYNKGDYFINHGKIVTAKTNEPISIWCIVSCTFLLTISVISVTTEDDGDINPSWEVNLNLKRAKSRFIECEKEGNLYYYTVGDRLIHESKRMLSENEILNLQWSFNNLNHLPRFKTKRRWRDHTMTHLGI